MSSCARPEAATVAFGMVMVIMIDEPRNGEHFGGLVAAPVFSKVMSGAMRLLDIAPDKISNDQLMNAANRRQDGQA